MWTTSHPSGKDPDPDDKAWHRRGEKSRAVAPHNSPPLALPWATSGRVIWPTASWVCEEGACPRSLLSSERGAGFQSINELPQASQAADFVPVWAMGPDHERCRAYRETERAKVQRGRPMGRHHLPSSGTRQGRKHDRLDGPPFRKCLPTGKRNERTETDEGPPSLARRGALAFQARHQGMPFRPSVVVGPLQPATHSTAS